LRIPPLIYARAGCNFRRTGRFSNTVHQRGGWC
jgi:hypothetical protein